MRFNNFIIFILSSLLFAQCIKEPEANGENLIDDFDRKEMLENLSDNFIIPGYQSYVTAITNLEQSILNFEGSLTISNYDLILNNFINSCEKWQSISFLEFGPAENIALRSQSNIYPIDTTIVQQNIQNGGYNLGVASNYAAKGWQALDYLLYKDSNADAVAYFSSNPNALHYLKDLLSDLKTNAQYVSNAWSSYRETFVNNNANNANGSAVSDMTNAIIAHYEGYIRKGKVGLPAGVFNGFSQAPMPQNVEGLYLNARLEYATVAMTYFKRFLNGLSYDGNADGLGLLDYANFVGAISDGTELSINVNAQIDRIIIANGNAIMPWSDFVQQNPAESKEIYLEYQKLIPLIKVDLTSALGIIITYQDNDGD